MKAYLINLESARDRLEYVTDLLNTVPILQTEVVPAVDGRMLSQSQVSELFNKEAFKCYYLKDPKPGEIGCTLSHQKCYRRLLNTDMKSVLILEDDIVFNRDINQLVPNIEDFLNCEEPRLLLLSGWFWYTSKKHFNDEYDICKVNDGYLTHAYAINRAAAKLMVINRPDFLADAWERFVRKGVKIYGLTPHPIDQDWSGVFKSDVLTNTNYSQKFVVKTWIKLKLRGAKQRFYKLIGHFEAPRNMHVRIDNIKDALK